MRDTVARLLEGVNTSDPRELAGEFMSGDGEFSQLLLRTVPRLIAAAAEIVKYAAASFGEMPEEKSSELLAEVLSQIDGKEIGEAMNAVNGLVIRFHEHNPELYPQKRLDIASKIVEELDFGKLRKATIFKNQERMGLLRSEVEMMGDEPMAVINMFSVITPMVNNLIEVLEAALEALSLPSEATAYALFKILQDIDWEGLTDIFNGLASFVVTLHRGNLLLGDGSMESRAVFSHISEHIVSNLNAQDLAEAIQAIGEEGEALITSLADAAMRNSELLVWLAGAATMVTNSYNIALANVMEKAGTIPADTLGKMIDEFAADFEERELARAISGLVALVRRMQAERPQLFGTIAKKTLSAADLDVTLTPEAMGSGVNAALASYNGLSRENAKRLEDNLDAFLASVDTGKLSQAAASISAQVAGAATRHPEVVRPLVKALLSLAYSAAKGYVKNLLNLGPKTKREVQAE